VVNTEVITLSELEEEVGDVKAQTRQRYSGPSWPSASARSTTWA